MSRFVCQLRILNRDLREDAAFDDGAGCFSVFLVRKCADGVAVCVVVTSHVAKPIDRNALKKLGVGLHCRGWLVRVSAIVVLNCLS